MFRIARRVCLAAATVVLLAPISANAASYEVHACSLPNGFPTGSDGWLPIGGGNGINLDNSCRAGTGVAGQMYGAGRQTVAPHLGGFAFTAPPGTTVVGVTLDRAARPDSHFSPNTYWYVTQGLPETVQPYLLENCTIGAGFCSAGKGSFSNRLDPTNRVSFSGFRAQQVFAFLSTWGSEQVSEPSLARFAIYRAVVGLLDESPPVVSAATGRLAAGGSVTGDTSVTVTAGDSGGGIAKIGLLVDDKVVAERPIDPADATCHLPYTRTVPCPTSTRTDLAFDTALLADGAHSARLFAVDVSGNRGVSSPFEFATRNGFRPNGANATRFATLEAWTGSARSRRSAATVGFKKTKLIRGELKTADGAPIAGAVIDVRSMHRRVGATERVVGTATTDGEGQFSYRAGAGPSRRFTFAYRAFTLDEGYSATDAIRIAVQPRVAFRVVPRSLRNGQRVTFAGRLVGGPGRGGVGVVIYALGGSGTRSRIPVESVRTDRAGRFRLRYRFRTVTRRSRFRFNARVQRQSGYPYASGTSRAVTVTVRP